MRCNALGEIFFFFSTEDRGVIIFFLFLKNDVFITRGIVKKEQRAITEEEKDGFITALVVWNPTKK